jgi:thiamine-phosphate pyrophosphorylase
MREVYRILDANFNRAREALRVAEDCGRFALNDPAITAMAKNLRSDLKEIFAAMPTVEMMAARDTAGDIGTELTSPMEPHRKDLADVATAACKRLTEALRTIEEYGKFVAPEHVRRIERMRYNGYTLEQRLATRLMVAKRFESVRLYVLIGSDCCRTGVRDTARQAIAGGADAIQLREKAVPDAQLLAMAAELRELTDETGKLLIINDRADIAALVGADGVHVGTDDLPVAEARKLLRPGAIVGKSGHNIDQMRANQNEGADYTSAGPVFATTTKDAGPTVGPELVGRAQDEIEIPVLPIGGISAANVRQLVDAGAKRVAVCAAICGADNPAKAAEQIRKLLD